MGQVLRLTMRSSRRPIQVTAEVVRVSTIGRRCEAGIKFLAVPPGVRAELHDLARPEVRERRAAG